MFCRPVEQLYPVKAHYAQKELRHEWSLDEQGVWGRYKDAHGYGQHRGIDFDCPVGSIVRAMADGVVIRCQYVPSLSSSVGAGLYILQLVDTPEHKSWTLCYAHLGAVFVAPGQEVLRGQPIAESGNSGLVLSPYLHVDLMDTKGQWANLSFAS